MIGGGLNSLLVYKRDNTLFGSGQINRLGTGSSSSDNQTTPVQLFYDGASASKPISDIKYLNFQPTEFYRWYVYK